MLFFGGAELEKIIYIIPIEVAEENFGVALSQQIDVNEIFKIITN